MGRSSNDDRSDSMNPNNDAYWASEDNRAHQIDNDNDDDDSSYASNNLSYPNPFTPYLPETAGSSSEPRVMDVEVVVPSEPVKLEGVYMLIVSSNEKQQRIKVDARNMEEAIADAKAVWNSRPLVYLALYDRESIYLEETRTERFPSEIRQSIAYLGHLEELISRAASMTSAARRSLDSDRTRHDRQALERYLEHYGMGNAALQGLRAEREERIRTLRAQGYDVTEENARDFGFSGKLALLADANAQWVRNFQAGKVQEDPIVETFRRRERILEIKV